jgi:hypothetical protein
MAGGGVYLVVIVAGFLFADAYLQISFASSEFLALLFAFYCAQLAFVPLVLGPVMARTSAGFGTVSARWALVISWRQRRHGAPRRDDLCGDAQRVVVVGRGAGLSRIRFFALRHGTAISCILPASYQPRRLVRASFATWSANRKELI